MPGSTARPVGLEDPALVELLELVGGLGLALREAGQSEDLPERLKRIQERLLLEGRECLARMADIDKKLESHRRAQISVIQIEPRGWFALTPAGQRELPEWRALLDLERVLKLVSGPRQQRIDDYSLFRRDPSSLLAIILENPIGGEGSSGALNAFEELAELIQRQGSLLGIDSARVLNAFVFRLLRFYRTHPTTLTIWGQRDKLKEFIAQARPYLPESLTSGGWSLVYGMDILLGGSSETGQGGRRWLLDAIREGIASTFPEIEEERHRIRLALAVLHALLDRKIQAPLLAERFLKVVGAALKEARACVPEDVPGEGPRMLFAYHLAHLAEFIPARLPEIAARYHRIATALPPHGGGTIPHQVALHALSCLERLDRMGSPVPIPEFTRTYQRVWHWIGRHKDLSRALSNEFSQPEDLPFLAANVTARAFFDASPRQAPGKPLPDVGVASAYEAPERITAPMLGLPFGTLMLE